MNRLQAILTGVVILVVCLLVFFVFVKPGMDRRAAARATATAVVAKGQAAAAKDATGVVVNQIERELDRAKSDTAIEAAIRRDDDPNAGLRGLCADPAYYNQQTCIQLRQSHPR